VGKGLNVPKVWRFQLDKKDVGRAQGWFKAGFDDRKWNRIRIGKSWESQGYEYDGVASYRTKLELTKDLTRTDLKIFFGGVDGGADTVCCLAMDRLDDLVNYVLKFRL